MDIYTWIYFYLPILLFIPAAGAPLAPIIGSALAGLGGAIAGLFGFGGGDKKPPASPPSPTAGFQQSAVDAIWALEPPEGTPIDDLWPEHTYGLPKWATDRLIAGSQETGVDLFNEVLRAPQLPNWFNSFFGTFTSTETPQAPAEEEVIHLPEPPVFSVDVFGQPPRPAEPPLPIPTPTRPAEPPLPLPFPAIGPDVNTIPGLPPFVVDVWGTPSPIPDITVPSELGPIVLPTPPQLPPQAPAPYPFPTPIPVPYPPPFGPTLTVPPFPAPVPQTPPPFPTSAPPTSVPPTSVPPTQAPPTSAPPSPGALGALAALAAGPSAPLPGQFAPVVGSPGPFQSLFQFPQLQQPRIPPLGFFIGGGY